MRPKLYYKGGINGNTKFWRSKCTLEAYSCPLTGYCMDNDVLAPIYAALETPYPYSFEDLINDCYQSWLNACEKDYEYQQSEVYFAEHCQANGYTFDVNGNMINF